LISVRIYKYEDLYETKNQHHELKEDPHNVALSARARFMKIPWLQYCNIVS